MLHPPLSLRIKELVEKNTPKPWGGITIQMEMFGQQSCKRTKKRGEEKILLQDQWRKGAAMDSAGPVSVMMKMKKNLKALAIGAGLYLLGLGTAFGFQASEEEVSAIAVEDVADLATEDHVSDEATEEVAEETTEEVAEQVATDSDNTDTTADDQAVEPAIAAGPTWINTAVTPSREGVEPVAGEALDEELIEEEEEDDPFELNGGEVPDPDKMPAPPAIGGDVGVIIPGQDDETAGDAGEDDTVVEEPSEDDSDDEIVDEPSDEDQDNSDEEVADEPETPADEEGEKGEDNGDVSEPEAPVEGEDDVVVEEPETPVEEEPAEPTIVREWDETVVYENNGFLVTNVFHYVEYSNGEVILLYKTSSSEPIAEEAPATVDEPAQETVEEPVEVAPVEETVEETVETTETTETTPEVVEVPAA